MPAGLYLGKEFDPKKGVLGARLELDPTDLLTHGLIVGMTGSGKTGLAIAMIEEVLRQGVPVLAIDPKGDLGNLLLLFDDLSPASFAAWVDPDAARRAGQSVDQAAAQASEAWKKGLANWGLGVADIQKLKQAHAATIFTPGSSAGRSLNVLQSLEAPSGSFDEVAEELRDEIAGIVSGLLGLLNIEADPLQSREYVFLTNLIEASWRGGKSLTLEALVAAVAQPPFDKIGALPLESVYPAKERNGLMLALNNLLASPGFAAWREGDPLEIESLLFTKDGKPRLSVVYTAHLQDQERLFITALLLDKVKTWMRRQRGTTELRALVYMDEIFGYFPPHPANPPTKRPLLTLLKQARAQGVSIVLATQNPVDLDYKGLGNIGTWLVGRLQTDQDRERLRDGLVGSGADAKAIDALLDTLQKRVFLLHDVHRSGPCLLHSRWALSYLRGPLTRDEISKLTHSGAEATPAAPKAAPAAPVSAGPPMLPAPFRGSYLNKYGGELADACLLVKFAVRYKDQGEQIQMRAYPLSSETAAEILEGEPTPLDESRLQAAAPAGLRYSELPAVLATAGAKGIEKALKERLADKLAVTLLVDPKTKAVSRPGEDKDTFAARLAGEAGGAGAQKLQGQIEKKKRDLAVAEQEEKGRETEKWAAAGTAALSMITGILGGRGPTISKAARGLSKANSVLTKNRLEGKAETRIELLKEEIAGLEAQLQEIAAVDPERLEQKTAVPAKGDVKILRYDVVWVY